MSSFAAAFSAKIVPPLHQRGLSLPLREGAGIKKGDAVNHSGDSAASCSLGLVPRINAEPRTTKLNAQRRRVDGDTNPPIKSGDDHDDLWLKSALLFPVLLGASI